MHKQFEKERVREWLDDAALCVAKAEQRAAEDDLHVAVMTVKTAIGSLCAALVETGKLMEIDESARGTDDDGGDAA